MISRQAKELVGEYRFRHIVALSRRQEIRTMLHCHRNTLMALYSARSPSTLHEFEQLGARVCSTTVKNIRPAKIRTSHSTLHEFEQLAARVCSTTVKNIRPAEIRTSYL